MTSRILSLARMIQSRTAAATRSVPAALSEPLKVLFGTTPCEDAAEDNEANHADRREHEEPAAEQAPGLFAALVRGPAAAGPAAAANTPWNAREERKASIRDYYHRAIAEGREAAANNDRVLRNPDLSVPDGERYLYIAQ